MRHVLIKIMLLLVIVLAEASCGYRFTPVGGIVPEGARNLAILTFINGTTEPYIDVTVTKAVVDEFIADGRLTVTGRENADIVLKGTITKFSAVPLSYTPDSYVQQYQVIIGINVAIEEAKTGKLLWQERGLGTVFSSSYAVAIGNISATKSSKDSAIQAASHDIASTLRSRVLEGF